MYVLHMTPVRKKYILFLLISIVAIGAAIAFYQYNKGPVDVKHAKGIKISAAALYHGFYKDSVTAVKKYSNKIVETTGVVAQVTNNQLNQPVVLLLTDETGAFVNCTMEDASAVIKEDQAVTIKGICTGIGMGDVDMGILGDVYLARCYLVK